NNNNNNNNNNNDYSQFGNYDIYNMSKPTNVTPTPQQFPQASNSHYVNVANTPPSGLPVNASPSNGGGSPIPDRNNNNNNNQFAAFPLYNPSAALQSSSMGQSNNTFEQLTTQPFSNPSPKPMSYQQTPYVDLTKFTAENR